MINITLGMKKICLIISIVLISMQISAQNRRTFIVLQDNSGSYYNSANSDINHIQNKLADLFSNKNILNKYSLISQELEQGELFFDPTLDKIHFYWFVADQADNVDYYFGTDDTYKKFEEYFLTPAKKYSQEENVESYFRSVFSDRPVLKSAYNGYGISTYSFTSFAYPLCIDVLPTEYSKEYIVVLISDFKAGSTFGNKQDEKIFRDAFRNKAQNVLDRVAHLNSQFVKIDLGEYYKDAGYNSIIGFYAFKIRPNAGFPNPENIEVRIDSDIHLEQKSYEGDSYELSSSKVVFKHSESLAIDKAYVEFTLPAGDIIRRDVTSMMNEKQGVFSFDKIDGIKLPGITSPFTEKTIGLRYIFDTSFSVDELKNQSIKYTFETNRTIDNSNFTFQTKLSTMEISAILFSFIAFIALVVFAWVTYNKRGKKALRGVYVKIWNVANSRFMELKDYHVVDRDCWYKRNGETQRLINITGSVDFQKVTFARPYQLKVEFKIDDVDSNEDFSFRPDGHENNGENKRKAHWYEVPLNSDGSFEINAIVYQVEGSTPDLENTYNILDMKVTVRAHLLLNGKDVVQPKEDEQYYHFIVRPEIANAALWMAFDPGTSGACVAYGIGGNPTDQTNIKIAYHTKTDLSGERQIPIFPSKVKIPDESSIIKRKGQVDMTTMREAYKYKEAGDFYFGDLAEVHEGRNSFQSIKKLLGYNDMQPLLDEKRNEICKIPGRDLALLLVKGLCNHFESYIRTSPDVTDKERSLFIQNDKFVPSRAIVAVPNNYTIVKAQDMVDSVKRTGLFKEVHYLYEAEAVMMCYLRNNWNDITIHPDSYTKEGRLFVVFDMGGATINATAFAINVITAENRNNKYIREIELSTKARVGYNVGGDDIDYAWIRILHQIPAVKEYLEDNKIDQEEHIRKHRTGILKFVQKLKLDWMERLAQNKPLDDEEISLLWMNISSDNGLPEFGISLQSEIDERSAKYIREEWSTRSIMKKYVLNAVATAVTELLSMEYAHNVEIIFSGRTSLYPGIRQTVTNAVETLAPKQSDIKDYSVWDGFEKGNTGKSIDEVVKTAVATGACWYAMFSKFIKLKHNIVTSTFGYVDMKHGKSTFVPLILRGTKLDEHGKKASDADYQVLTPNLPNVRILQMLTTKHEEVIRGLSSANRADNDNVKHLVNQLVHLTNDEIDGEIKGIIISVDDKNNFSYQVNVAGGLSLTGSGTVNDADIKTENSDAYAFSAMPCSEDETEDRRAETASDLTFSDKTAYSQNEVSGDEKKHKNSNAKNRF